jgi:outer membrane protein assembly factor BamB
MHAVKRPALSVITISCLITPLLCAAHNASGAETPAAEAKQIIESSGLTGGLVVHIGCGDGKLTTALRVKDNILVHGLDTSAKNIATAREHIQSLGIYGKVSVERLMSRSLPYASNMVNLVVAENLGQITQAEIVRVLAPGGVVQIKTDGKWKKTVKPVPKNIDEWTHYLHGSNNNAVAKDTVVAPPARVQWICGPQWARSHDHLSSTSAMVSAGGRVFYIIDEGPTAFAAMKPRWKLVARDAFNGVLLWKRDIDPWEGHLRGFRTGPAELARRLVAVGKRVYVTLGYGKPITALNAATGETVKTYENTTGTIEFICHNAALHAVVGDREPDNTSGASVPVEPKDIWHWWPVYKETPPKKHLVAVDTKTGKLLWKKDDADTIEMLPTALAAAGERTFIENPTHVVALNAKTGKLLWRVPRATARKRPSWTAPTLVVCDGVVLSADRAVGKASPPSDTKRKVNWTVDTLGGRSPVGVLVAFSAETGKKLWDAPAREVYNAPVDVLVADGLVWTGSMVGRRDPGITAGRDLKTGKIVRTRPEDSTQFKPGPVHHRCYRNKATQRFLVLGRDGIEFINIATGKGQSNSWTRGACQYGVMPCNGLVYVPPHSCACHIEYKLSNFNALAPAEKSDEPKKTPRFEKGPAFDKVPKSTTGERESWSTYRGDASRGGATRSVVSSDLTSMWQAKIDGRLSAVTIAGGRVFVAAIDEHTIHCLDAKNGRPVWKYVAGGPVDSPPTIWGGRAIFGCSDGWIYCLRASDGELVWRFGAAGAGRRIVSYGQLESVRPISGSVTIVKGVVYATAGRSTFLDGGLTLYRIDAVTGKMLSATPITTDSLPDVLSSDSSSVFMRHLRFDMSGKLLDTPAVHLYSSAGFLDGMWWHRTYWQVGTNMGSTWGGWPGTGNRVPSGRILVLDKSDVYGFGRLNQYHRNGSHVGMGKTAYQLFAIDRAEQQPTKPGKPAKGRRRRAPKVTVKWSRNVSVMVRAMVLSSAGDKKLFIAGPPNILGSVDPRGMHPYTLKAPKALKEQSAAFEGKRGGSIWTISAADGKMLSKTALPAPPVWDGMSASGGRVYIATMDGKVACYGKK